MVLYFISDDLFFVFYTDSYLFFITRILYKLRRFKIYNLYNYYKMYLISAISKNSQNAGLAVSRNFIF